MTIRYRKTRNRFVLETETVKVGVFLMGNCFSAERLHRSLSFARRALSVHGVSDCGLRKSTACSFCTFFSVGSIGYLPRNDTADGS